MHGKVEAAEQQALSNEETHRAQLNLCTVVAQEAKQRLTDKQEATTAATAVPGILHTPSKWRLLLLLKLLPAA